jgi:hypothetical protein
MNNDYTGYRLRLSLVLTSFYLDSDHAIFLPIQSTAAIARTVRFTSKLHELPLRNINFLQEKRVEATEKRGKEEKT